MGKPAGRVTIDSERCKGCGLCVAFCPQSILIVDGGATNSHGYQVVRVNDQAACIGCMNCAIMCPDCALTVERSSVPRIAQSAVGGAAR